MKKTSRQRIIRSIITSNAVETQDELLQLLEEEGVQATQATISRDIREMNIVKGHAADGKVKYIVLEKKTSLMEERLKEAIRESVEKVIQIQFLLIIHTYKGSSNIVGALFDEMELAEVGGTLAGKDTLVIFTHTEEEATKIRALIEENIEQV